jgi:hypothetical protein
VKYGVFLFNNTTAAIQAQKVLNAKGYSVTLMPCPRRFTSNSGLAVKFNLMEKAAVEEVLDKANVQIQTVQGV